MKCCRAKAILLSVLVSSSCNSRKFKQVLKLNDTPLEDQYLLTDTGEILTVIGNADYEQDFDVEKISKKKNIKINSKWKI